MATVYEADITDLVKPHLEKARLEGREEGFQKGEFKKAIETARKMREKGFSNQEILEITGLTMDQLKEHGIFG